MITLFQHTHTELQKRASRSVDISLVIRNWLFGWYLVEFEIAGASRSEMYGKKLIPQIANALKERGLKGLSARNLSSYTKFYKEYSEISQTMPAQSSDGTLNTILQAVPAKSSDGKSGTTNTNKSPLNQIIKGLADRFTLGWTHYVTLLTISNKDERRFYEIEAAENSWGYRELERQINSSLYERLALSKDKQGIKELSHKGQIVEKSEDVIKNPYILEFTGLEEHYLYSEHELETALISGLENFLLELGKGFLFEARQKRFTFDNNHFYVDLVFYNRLLQCYVLIDLKREELTHQDLGQMQMYVNYFDRYVKKEFEKPTIGILLCHRKSDALVELTLPSNSNIFASEYQLYLPSKEELRQKLIELETEVEENIHNKTIGDDVPPTL